jgi:hypothetical protein
MVYDITNDAKCRGREELDERLGGHVVMIANCRRLCRARVSPIHSELPYTKRRSTALPVRGKGALKPQWRRSYFGDTALEPFYMFQVIKCCLRGRSQLF